MRAVLTFRLGHVHAYRGPYEFVNNVLLNKSGFIAGAKYPQIFVAYCLA